MLKDNQDAVGHGMYDHMNGIRGAEIVERDDGYVDPTGGPEAFFAPYAKWSAAERRAMRCVKGRVLDIGCGAGRHSLYLQERGHDVVGIDNSPLAIEVCKKKGLKDARLLSISQVGPTLGVFDTVIMLGNSFGLFGTPERAKRLLKRFHRVTSKNARIIAGSIDIYATDNPEDLPDRATNIARGKMPGQLRFRIRYKRYSTPWFDWLTVSMKEMESILQGTGWAATKFIDSGGPRYVAVIEKTRI